MVPPFAIVPCRPAVGLSARYIQGPLFFVSLDRSSMGGAGTLGSQHTSGTNSGRRLVFGGATNRMHSPRVKSLCSRTKINVACGIITKSFIAKNRLLSPLLGFA